MIHLVGKGAMKCEERHNEYILEGSIWQQSVLGRSDFYFPFFIYLSTGRWAKKENRIKQNMDVSKSPIVDSIIPTLVLGVRAVHENTRI